MAKNVGTVFGAASVAGYASGYLALRARAFALGTDPAFKLVDQVYVFAGVRFLVATLIVLLVLAPVVLIARYTALRLWIRFPGGILRRVEWIALISLGVATLASMQILKASGVLLRADPLPRAGLEGAVLGGSDGLRLGLIVAVVLLAGLSALWLYHRFTVEPGQLGWILAGIVALQVFMLPVYHGALLADRRVRVLSELPATVRRLVMPIAIVDRTADQATLLGLDAAGRRGLVTVALEDLNGIPVQAVLSLEAFLRQIESGHHKAASDVALEVRVAEAQTTTSDAIATDRMPQSTSNFYASLTEYFGFVLESIGSLGGGAVEAGELWIVELEPSGRPISRHRVGDLDDISWPVLGVDGTSFIALQDGRVVRLDAHGAVMAVLADGGGWLKLLGQRADGSVLGFVRSQGEIRPAELGPDGTTRIGSAAYTDEEKRTVARLLQDARAYASGWVVSVDRSERGGRGFDVFLRSSKGTFNLSNCADGYCGQASLAREGRYAVFVKASR